MAFCLLLIWGSVVLPLWERIFISTGAIFVNRQIKQMSLKWHVSVLSFQGNQSSSVDLERGRVGGVCVIIILHTKLVLLFDMWISLPCQLQIAVSQPLHLTINHVYVNMIYNKCKDLSCQVIIFHIIYGGQSLIFLSETYIVLYSKCHNLGEKYLTWNIPCVSYLCLTHENKKTKQWKCWLNMKPCHALREVWTEKIPKWILIWWGNHGSLSHWYWSTDLSFASYLWMFYILWNV